MSTLSPICCERCGRERRVSRGGDRDARRFCSKACAGATRTKVKQERLALERIGRRARARPKSPGYQPVKAQGPFTLRCKECGSTVVRLTRVSLATCDPCKDKAAEASKREWLRTEKGREHRRASKKAYKVRRKGRTAVVETFSATSILERDNWTCQICGCATPKHLRGTTDDNAPEVDHIIPLALGGAHAKWNVQCACRLCNWLKGATVTGGHEPLATEA